MDAFYKTLGVQNNLTIRGAPLLVEKSKINPIFLNEISSNDEMDCLKQELKELRADYESLKEVVKQLANAPVPAALAPVSVQVPVVNECESPTPPPTPSSKKNNKPKKDN